VKNGVPFDRAFGLSESSNYDLSTADMDAMGIIFAEFEGAQFDLASMSFKDRR
jgi:hypothetical protein